MTRKTGDRLSVRCSSSFPSLSARRRCRWLVFCFVALHSVPAGRRSRGSRDRLPRRLVHFCHFFARLPSRTIAEGRAWSHSSPASPIGSGATQFAPSSLSFLLSFFSISPDSRTRLSTTFTPTNTNMQAQRGHLDRDNGDIEVARRKSPVPPPSISIDSFHRAGSRQRSSTQRRRPPRRADPSPPARLSTCRTGREGGRDFVIFSPTPVLAALLTRVLARPLRFITIILHVQHWI